MSTIEDVRLLRHRDAARLLSISVTTLDELVKHGTITPVRSARNGNRRFRLRDLETLAETGKDARRGAFTLPAPRRRPLLLDAGARVRANVRANDRPFRPFSGVLGRVSR